MDKEVDEVRLAGWKKVIQECQSRPAGMTEKAWLEQNGIPRYRFFYWLRKVRREAISEMSSSEDGQSLPAVRHEAGQTVTFAEIDVTKLGTAAPAQNQPAAVIRYGQLAVELSNGADEALIAGIIKAVSHAC